METSDGFTPIVAIFYAVFHPTEGTKIINQVPNNIINNTESTLFNFNTVKNYIIPKPKLCNKLISIKIGKYKVIGFPVNIHNESYIRNFFNFNFCFVFPYNSETVSYELTIKRLGRMFKVLEEQNFLLSSVNSEIFIKLENLQRMNLISEIPGFKNFKKINLSSIESLIVQIYQDLNNYSECCIPLDSSNSVDIKLFPVLPEPLNLKAYQVPILMVNLSSLVDVNWDPTMLKILPYIDGINSIKRISELSDSDYLLTKQCIQHLMHYKCLQIIDIFQFSNIYAPTNNIDNFLKIPGLSSRCQSYIINYDIEKPVFTATDSISVSPIHVKEMKQHIKVPLVIMLFYLYRSLNQGQTIKQWILQHKKHLKHIDVRRFVNFGVLNGLIYRVHSYPILSLITKLIEINKDEMTKLLQEIQERLESSNVNTTANDTDSSRKYLKSIVNELNLKTNHRRISFNYQKQPFSDIVEDDEEYFEELDEPVPDVPSVSKGQFDDLLKLIKLLKGFQTIDSICTELQKSRAEIQAMLDTLGSNGFINC